MGRGEGGETGREGEGFLRNMEGVEETKGEASAMVLVGWGRRDEVCALRPQRNRPN